MLPASGGQGLFLKKPPLNPAKTFVYILPPTTDLTFFVYLLKI
jgi:hypothetical protein